MSTLPQTRAMLAADLKPSPHLKAHGGKIMKNLAILASDADEETKAAALAVLPGNVKRFEAAPASRSAIHRRRGRNHEPSPAAEGWNTMTTGPEYLKQYRTRTAAGGGLRAREWDHFDELEKTLDPEAYAARRAAGAREFSLKRARTLSIEDLEMLLREARPALSPPEPTARYEMFMVGLGALQVAIDCDDPKRELLVRIKDLIAEAVAHRAMPLQDHASEVLCACADSCAKDTENTKLRAALQRMLAVCDIGAHDSCDIYRACEFARGSMIAEDGAKS